MFPGVWRRLSRGCGGSARRILRVFSWFYVCHSFDFFSMSPSTVVCVRLQIVHPRKSFVQCGEEKNREKLRVFCEAGQRSKVDMPHPKVITGDALLIVIIKRYLTHYELILEEERLNSCLFRSHTHSLVKNIFSLSLGRDDTLRREKRTWRRVNT